MIYKDKSIQCSDCNTTFTFSAEEQEQFASRGYTNEPKRCPTCREERKSKQYANGGNAYNRSNSRNSGSYGNRSYNSAPRQMFPVVCATCGKNTEVPFEPRGDRPVYCSDCYRKTNPVRNY
ncbi:MAG: zinc-ribbon domain containing protein [Dehalococcoidales bacterium]|nr:zinc-ribbon domain containing protein [Dehalococcoidales bacterium]